MSNPLAALADQLRVRGIISAEAPEPPDESDDRPWFIALMLGVAGWLAGILLLVFIGIAFKPDSRATLIIAGLVLLATAWAIYRLDKEGAFLDQFALAISVAGQIAVCIGVNMEDTSETAIAATALVVQAIVFFVMPNRTARTLAALFGAIAWLFLVRLALHSGRSGDLFFESSARDYVGGLGLITLLLSWAVTWGPLVFAAIWLTRREPRWMADGLRELARPLLTGVLIALAVGGVISEPFAFIAMGMDSWGLNMGWSGIFPLLSIALAMLAAYGAFRVRSLGLLGVAIAGALLHLSRFYYLYGTTLLWKSAIMFVAGAALLIAGVAAHRKLQAAQPASPGAA